MELQKFAGYFAIAFVLLYPPVANSTLCSTAMGSHPNSPNSYDTPEKAYLGIMSEILRSGVNDGEGNLEVLNLAFDIGRPDPVDFSGSAVRRFNRDYAEHLFRWILSGSNDPTALLAVNPKAGDFFDPAAPRNTAYGPRILSQLPGIIQELTERPTSRRASIMILDAEDQSLLRPKQQGCKAEYPCTFSLTFLIRDGFLHLHVAMRSNNMTTTIQYDLFNFIGIQTTVLGLLQKAGMPTLKLGRYFHVCASAHILKKDIDFARSIVAEATRTTP